MGTYSASPSEIDQFNQTNAMAPPAAGAPGALDGFWSSLAVQVPRAAAEVNLAARRAASALDTAVSERLPGEFLARRAVRSGETPLGAISVNETLKSMEQQLAARRDARYGVPEAVDQLNRIQTDPNTTGWAASAVGDIVGTVAKYGLAARAGTLAPAARGITVDGSAASLTTRALELVNQQRRMAPFLSMAAVNHTLMAASGIADLVHQGVPLDVAQQIQSENNVLQDAFLLAPGGARGALKGAATAGGIAIGMDAATRNLTADQLESAGHHDLAEQYRQFNVQATLVNAVAFAALGALHGRAAHLEAMQAEAKRAGDQKAVADLQAEIDANRAEQELKAHQIAEQMAGGAPEVDATPLPGETPDQTQARVQAAQKALDESVAERTQIGQRIAEIDAGRQNDVALLELARRDLSGDQSLPRQQAAREALLAQGRWEAGQQEAVRQYAADRGTIDASTGAQIRDRLARIQQIMLDQIKMLQAKAMSGFPEGFDSATATKLNELMAARHDPATAEQWALRQVPNQGRPFEVAQAHAIALELQPLRERMADELRQAHDRAAREQIIPRLASYRAALQRYRATLTSERAPLVRRASLALANDPRIRAELKDAQEAAAAQQDQNGVPNAALDGALTLMDEQHATESAMPGAPKTQDAHEQALAAAKLAMDQAWHGDTVTAEVPERDYTQAHDHEVRAQEHSDAQAAIHDALREVGIEPLTEAEAAKLMERAAKGKISPFDAERLARHLNVENPVEEEQRPVLTAKEAKRLYKAAVKAREEGKPTPLETSLEPPETPPLNEAEAGQPYQTDLERMQAENASAPDENGEARPVNEQLDAAQRAVDAAKEEAPGWKAAGQCAGDRS